jgi:hypothetical protein
MGFDRPPDDRGLVVRPYTLTGGRTGTGRPLAVETLVSTTPLGMASAATLDSEQEAITLLCRAPLSVAEIAARLRLPLGVVRVLVSDMADDGIVTLHHPPPPGDRPDSELLKRVLHGLRTARIH